MNNWLSYGTLRGVVTPSQLLRPLRIQVRGAHGQSDVHYLFPARPLLAQHL
jgi:hypothetical protein